MANWSDIFNPAQNCECDDCMSIFSPAAYLVDIMQYLDNCPKNSNGLSPLGVLFERRPDIGKLLLTCANTNTEIPYIDLVNEIMEYYVAHSKDNSINFNAGDTGDANASELKAEPQYIILDAYRTIYMDSVYPFTLPYHQPLDVIRSYLNFLKTSSAELMEVFPNYNGALIPSGALDAERLSLSLKEYEILTNADFSGNDLGNISPEIYYGNPNPPYTNSGIDVTDLLKRTGLNYVDLIKILETKFINPGQDAYKVLQGLMAVSAIQPQYLYSEIKTGAWNNNTSETYTKLLEPNNITLVDFGNWLTTPDNGSTNFQNFQSLITLFETVSGQATSDCDLTHTSLHSLQWIYESALPAPDNVINGSFLSNLHRFIRLQQKTGWDIHELDAIIVSIGKSSIDKDLIHNLGIINKINSVLNLPLLNLACLWGNIDSYGNNSLYNQLFLNRNANTTGQTLNPFVPNPLNEIVANNYLIMDYLTELRAALAISAEDLMIILSDAAIDPETGKLSLENLSMMYRYKLLSTALNLSIGDFCILKSPLHFNINPFANADNTLEFTQNIQSFQSSGLNVFSLNYILSGKTNIIHNIGLSQDIILQTISDLQKKILAISGDNSQLKRAQFISNVSALVGLDAATAGTLIYAELDNLISTISEQGLTGTYYGDTNFQTVVKTRTDPNINFNWGANSPDPTIPVDNFSIRWKGYLRPPADDNYTFTLNISETDETARLWIDGLKIIDINPPGTNPLITSKQVAVSLTGGILHSVVLEYVENSNNAEIQLFWQSRSLPLTIIDSGFFYPDNNIQTLTQNIVAYHRSAQFINGFTLSAAEVKYFVNNKSDFDNIDFLNLTTTNWKSIYNYIKLRKIIPTASLLSLFQTAIKEFDINNDAIPSDDLISAIANCTGWNKDYLSYLAGNAEYPTSTPPVGPIKSFYGLTIKDFKTETAFLKIKQALDLAKRTNMPITDTGLPAWSKIETTVSSADDFNSLHGIALQIKDAVKSKYKDNWLDIAGKLNDSIRENQKQALISYMLTLNLSLNGTSVTNADSLYEYLLIDAQMTSKVVTSRLIQTTMAVQLFAQRCLLSLENNEVATSSIDPVEWDWMKHYRIAAGLKKLFINTENYLIPSLRDDKSPFFKELESELTKGDITDENAENAFRDYLHKLNEVSNMEVCGMYNDEDTKTLYVFARSHSASPNYYHRIRDSYGHWSAWEPVQLDIKSIDDGDNSGVHLMPIIWKKRLFLFWPEFMQKSIGANTRSSSFADISNTSPNNTAPQKYWEIRLAWSEYTNGKWTPKKISKETLTPLMSLAFQNILAPTKPKQYFFQSAIDSNNVLTIGLYIRYSQQDKDFRYDNGAVPIASFQITDIHEKILITSEFLFSNGTTMEQINVAYSHDEKIFDGDEDFNEPFYQSFKETHKLDIAGIDLLNKRLDHKVLFSNDVSINEFENNLIYPFFYSDKKAQRVYFATPVNLGISIAINGFKNAASASLALFNTNKFSLKIPLTEDLAKSSFTTSGNSKKLPLNSKSFLKSPPVINNLANNPDARIEKRSQQYFRDVEEGLPAFFSDQAAGYSLYFPKLEFYNFNHPFAPAFIKKLNEGGVPFLLAADTAEFPGDSAQGNIDTNPILIANDEGTTFNNYNPNYTCIIKYDPVDLKRNYYLRNVDFSEYGTYSIYNWELFFHAPFLIATQLSNNGRYAEARNWFHYIFNPLSTENPAANNVNSSYWQVLPFKKTSPSQDIIQFIENLQPGYDTDPTQPANADNAQIDEWRADPFNAFLIARNRPITFMKNVVMSYLDNLITWGDDLFRAYTRENINEATQLYVMAAHILGDKPQYIPSRGKVQSSSYNALKSILNDLGDPMITYENDFPNSGEISQTDNSIPQGLLGIGQTLYFCVPPNDKLLSYWTKIGDRLFKIRHGQNIDGIFKPLALYESPIDPALLLKAKAQGLDISSIFADLESPTPLYRFTYLIQKAKEFCSEVVSMGNALLSANEKQNAEALSRIRQTQEITMLQMVKEVKNRQVLEAQANLDALIVSRTTSIQKLQYYATELLGNPETSIPRAPDLSDNLTVDSSLPGETIIAPASSSIDVSLTGTDESGVKVIPKEKQAMRYNDNAKWSQLLGNSADTLASIFHLLPDFGIMASPLGAGTTSKISGGQQMGDSISALARGLMGTSSFYSAEANSASTMASFIRREQEWVFQANMTAREIVQLDKQITVAQIRLQMAEHELDNHNRQIENSQDIEQFLEAKFSNQELYQWMIDKLRDVHKQGYQLGYDMARKAEKAYRFELGIQDSSFIQYGYFQDSYLGITAGEQLQLALKQLESAFIENNVRKFELTKHISMLSLDPSALLLLKETGTCIFSIPEEWYDMDYPGHYLRTIDSVSLSIPCIAGPFTTINSTLRLNRNSIRINSDLSNNNYTSSGTDDSRFVENSILFTTIATSSAQNDSGTFELNFRDERYLPFEGSGAISTWQLELNGKYLTTDRDSIIDLSQFDYSSISDILIHIRYSAREDTGDFRNHAIQNLQNYKTKSNFRRLISMRHDIPDGFYSFINQPLTNGDQSVILTLDKSWFPYFASRNTINIDTIELFADSKSLSELLLTLDPSPAPNPVHLSTSVSGTMMQGSADYSQAALKIDSTYDLKISIIRPSDPNPLTNDNFKNLYLIIHYSLE